MLAMAENKYNKITYYYKGDSINFSAFILLQDFIVH